MAATVRLPDAEVQFPSCGVCARETDYDGEVFTCDDCLLEFDRDTYTAAFRDPTAEACGKPCDNQWHADNRIKAGIGYHCGTCKLPAGHTSRYWTGCQQRAAVSRG